MADGTKVVTTTMPDGTQHVSVRARNRGSGFKRADKPATDGPWRSKKLKNLSPDWINWENDLGWPGNESDESSLNDLPTDKSDACKNIPLPKGPQNQDEAAAFKVQNRIRTKPSLSTNPIRQQFGQFIQNKQTGKFDILIQKTSRIVTKEGRNHWRDAAKIMKTKIKRTAALEWSDGLAKAARDHCFDIERLERE